MGSDVRRLVAIIDSQTRIGGAGLDSGAILSVGAREARSLTGANASVIELVDPAGLVFQGAADNAVVRVGQAMDRDTPSARAITTREVVTCEDTERERAGEEEIRPPGSRSLIAAPITLDDRTLGVLTVGWTEAKAFDEEDGATLGQLARFLGSQLDHARRFEEAHRTSRRDPLTGLGNRRALDECLATELDRRSRYGNVLSVCLFDLDHFKAVNDTAGHDAGDRVLQRVAERLSAIRGADSAFRLGGDEFALVLPETGSGAAELVARRLSHRIQDDALAYGVTASWGVAEATGADPGELLAQADSQLYARKRGPGPNLSAAAD